MALGGVELGTLVSEPDALTTRPLSFELTLNKKDRQNGEHRKGRVFIGAELPITASK